ELELALERLLRVNVAALHLHDAVVQQLPLGRPALPVLVLVLVYPAVEVPAAEQDDGVLGRGHALDVLGISLVADLQVFQVAVLGVGGAGGGQQRQADEGRRGSHGAGLREGGTVRRGGGVLAGGGVSARGAQAGCVR